MKILRERVVSSTFQTGSWVKKYRVDDYSKKHSSAREYLWSGYMLLFIHATRHLTDLGQTVTDHTQIHSYAIY